MTTADIAFISHGGGPLPLLNDPGHHELVLQLEALAKQFKKPKAILIISAHWEASQATVTAATQPSLIYDYSGFPSESYDIQYPLKGDEALAGAIANALQKNKIPAQKDTQRGFDHGVFVPLKIMYPDADIPCVQLSLIKGLDPSTHIQLGKALREIEQSDLLVIGSGFSFHNMQAFFSTNTPEIQKANATFQRWLTETCSSVSLSESEREQRLIQWASAPQARFCHPREEHLLPLHVCAAMAGRAADQHVSCTILGKASGMYYWQTPSKNQHG